MTLTSTLFIMAYPFNIDAQVNVNQSALDKLGPAKKTTSQHQVHKKTTTTHKKHINSKTVSSKTKATQPNPTPSNQTHAPIPSIPNAPPPIPVIKEPDLNVALHPPTPPEMPKIVPNAPGNALIAPQHTIINFAGDSADLNENMMKAIMDVANNLKQHPDTQIYLNAYSHGTPDDISMPRRNALNRGLVIRAVLINQGIPATRIYLIAKGIPQTTTQTNADYVEMIRSDLLPKSK